MSKFFNCSGPCVPGKHYMIDPSERLGDIRQLIDEERYFILHAPRQTGKTTNMSLLANRLNEEGRYVALYANIEAGQALRNEVERVNKLIMFNFKRSALLQLPPELRPSPQCFEVDSMDEAVLSFLTNWCLELPKPLVLFIDEIDSLIGDSLISVLRQLRGGYNDRPRGFPHALCLIGLRDVRDYRIYSDVNKKYILGGSAFNIKEESISLEYFTFDQVENLYLQHTEATNQPFQKETLERVFYWSQGQPWIVNALGRELCFGKKAVPYDKTVTPEDVDNAIEILILRRDTHLDQLADKLMEDRVTPIIEKILIGEEINLDNRSILEDRKYLVDLGLLRQGEQGLEVANPLYREIIPRELTSITQESLGQNPAWYVTEEGKLDIHKVLDAFVEFYKESGEMLTSRKFYTESAHHLLFMAWLQRITNGGGHVRREYGAGLGRLDLYVEFAGERFAFELKLDGKTVLEKGKKQLTRYLERLSLDSGWLVIFHRKTIKDWDELGERETIRHQRKTIEVIWL